MRAAGYRVPLGTASWRTEHYSDIGSNIHYDYVGTAAGFDEGVLLDGAGLEQIGDHSSRGRSSLSLAMLCVVLFGSACVRHDDLRVRVFNDLLRSSRMFTSSVAPTKPGGRLWRPGHRWEPCFDRKASHNSA